MHVQFMRIWAWMHDFVLLEWVWWKIGTCMWFICEIELHWVVIWGLYNVSTYVFEVWAIACKKCWVNVELELKNMFWKTQKIWCPLKRGDCRSSIKYVLLAFFCRHGVRSSGELCRMAFRSSGRVYARAWNWHNQFFCWPIGSARAGTLCSDNFESVFYVSFSILFYLQALLGMH